jgi:hypothetical protein
VRRAEQPGGAGAFVVEAQDFDAFGQALIAKLMREIAGATQADVIPELAPANVRDPKPSSKVAKTGSRL